MIKLNAREKMEDLGKCMEIGGENVLSVVKGEIVGASFYDDEKGEIRKTPRLYVDLDDDIPVGHYRVYIVEVAEDTKGNTDD